MRQKTLQKHYRIILVYINDMTRTVSIRAANREVAEQRALKHNPGALTVRRTS
jgi:hypothetical protein